MPRRTKPYLLHASFRPDAEIDPASYPFSIAAVRELGNIDFHPNVTFYPTGWNGCFAMPMTPESGADMITSEADRQRRLLAIARDSAWFMRALAAVRQLALPDGCIGAGAVRNLVWDALHEKPSPSALSDVDVAYFDPADVSPQRDHDLQRQLAALCPGVPWEVTNQAGVHYWFEAHFGHAVEPLQSIEAAVASWPEFATSVALSLAPDDSLRVIAPQGLADLFEIVVRRNPARVSVATYRQRVEQKRYAERWPRVRVIAG